MDWWNSFIDWAQSGSGWRIISGAIIPFVAIVVAGVVAALIGRGATKRVITLQERESKNAAVGGVISAARKAATWGSLGHDERAYADHLAEDADIRLRLLPISGAAVAANWAQHEIADIKKNSSTFSFQAEQSLAEFRDRMLEWQAKPTKARKLFRYDLERWKFETPDGDADLVQRQQQWNADQVAPATAPAAASTPTTTALRPAAQSTTPLASGTASSADEWPLRSGGTTPDRPAASAPSTAGSASAGLASAGPVAGAVAETSSLNDTASVDDAVPVGGFGTDASRPVQASEHTNAASSAAASSTPANRTTDATTPLGGAPYGARPVPSTASGAPGSVVPKDETPASPSAPAEDDGALTDPKVDATAGVGHNTTSIPTRISDAPAEPADPDETNEAPYASPLSASELRRRAEDDDE